MEKILILTGDETAGSFLGVLFRREHFLTFLVTSSDGAIQELCRLQPDIAIIDTPIEGVGALDMCRRFQNWQFSKPILILGNSGEEMDKVLALEAGADDYIVKPSSPRELVARVRAILRRRRSNVESKIRFGDVEVDRSRRTVTCQGKEVKMTPCEYKLLLFFLGNVDLAITRETLLSSVWGYSLDANTRTLDAHVSKLRNKFECDPSMPQHFLTVHGVGYRFIP